MHTGWVRDGLAACHHRWKQPVWLAQVKLFGWDLVDAQGKEKPLAQLISARQDTVGLPGCALSLSVLSFALKLRCHLMGAAYFDTAGSVVASGFDFCRHRCSIATTIVETRLDLDAVWWFARFNLHRLKCASGHLNNRNLCMWTWRGSRPEVPYMKRPMWLAWLKRLGWDFFRNNFGRAKQLLLLSSLQSWTR